jgi:non-specific protein-tyrosine kinase
MTGPPPPAREAADIILVDSPPLLMVADALTLAAHVDGVILAARANETTRDEAHQVVSMLGRVGAKPFGLVVGGIKPRRNSYYYRYGYYQQEVPAE